MQQSNAKLEALVKLMTKSDEDALYGFDLIIKKSVEKPNILMSIFPELDNNGFFDPKKNLPKIKVDGTENYRIPYWPALNYLKEIARYTKDPEHSNINSRIIEIIKEASNNQLNGEYVNNFHTYSAFIEIFAYLPSHLVTNAEISLVRKWLESDYGIGAIARSISKFLIPNLLKSDDNKNYVKACLVLDYCLETKTSTSEYKKPESIVEEYWLKDLINNNISLYGEKCPAQALEILRNRLTKAFNSYNLSSWSIRPAIEDHKQNDHHNNYMNCVITATRDMAIILVNSKIIAAKNLLKNFLNSKISIERRIGIYLLNIKFSKFKNLTNLVIDLIEDYDNYHELYEFYYAHYSEFNITLKKNIYESIVNLKKAKGKNAKIYLIQRQLNWLNAINNKGYKPADDKFNELNLTNIGKISKHPSFLSYMEVRNGFGEPEYNTQQLIDFLEQGTLIEKLNTIKVSPTSYWGDDKIRPQSEVLEQLVNSEPLKIGEHIENFYNANRPYQHGLINGYKKLWQADNKALDKDQWDEIWTKLVKLFENILLDEDFWSEEVKDGYNPVPNRDWIIQTIFDFLRVGVRINERSIPFKHSKKVEKLIVIALNKTNSDFRFDYKDSMTAAINTLKGYTVQALVDYCLYVARHYKNNKPAYKKFWSNIEKTYDEELAKCKNDNFEFSTLMGSYILNIQFLSKDWLKRHIELIFPANYQKNFICALDGFAYSPVNKSLYSLMAEKNIIFKALHTQFDNDDSRERLIEKIGLSYIWGNENLDSIHFNFLFQKENISDLKTMTRFFWSLGRRERKETNNDPDYSNLIIEFWRKAFLFCNNNLNDSEPLIEELGLLIIYLDKIESEEFEWLKKSAHYIAKRYDTYSFFQELDLFADAYPLQVSEILEIIIKQKTPDYDLDNHLVSIVRKVNRSLPDKAKTLINGLRNLNGFYELNKELFPN